MLGVFSLRVRMLVVLPIELWTLGVVRTAVFEFSYNVRVRAVPSSCGNEIKSVNSNVILVEEK